MTHLPVFFLQLSLRESVYFFHLEEDCSLVPYHYLLYSSLYSSCLPLCFCHLSSVASFKLATCFCAMKRAFCSSPPVLGQLSLPSASIPQLTKLGSGSAAMHCCASAAPLGGNVSEHSRDLVVFYGTNRAVRADKPCCSARKWSVSDYGDVGQRSAYCLCTFRASSSPKADICHHSDKGASNPKAVWEVSLKRMTVTLCPPCFNFSADPLGSGSSIKTTTKGKRGDPHGHSVFVGLDCNGLILLMAVVTAGY